MHRITYDKRWLRVKRIAWSRAIAIRIRAEQLEAEARRNYLEAQDAFDQLHADDSKVAV